MAKPKISSGSLPLHGSNLEILIITHESRCSEQASFLQLVARGVARLRRAPEGGASLAFPQCGGQPRLPARFPGVGGDGVITERRADGSAEVGYVTGKHAEPASGTAQGGGDAAAVEGSPARPAEPPQGDPAALSRSSSIPPERPPSLGLCGANPPTSASAVTTCCGEMHI
ncbi:snRNA-activating protein complex subunit 5 isoform X1 [Piliocolobus tephrosceles]|uniref:snRNA-activating protein complex subunit 5 isoform X1 n=1 Tax=Piliocolobus tephrosceles TaxID=591936 RepID=UPI000C297DA9|nr:snRNA-activating protein complex subunit 5 isoform X1 [Piliocolobus tephrosceles]